MNFSEYQHKAIRTAVYPAAGQRKVQGQMYTAMGLAGEAGEIANVVKKLYRDGPKDVRAELEDELGDVLWYVSQLCTEMALDLDAVARGNLNKLMNRRESGTLHGHNRKAEA